MQRTLHSPGPVYPGKVASSHKSSLRKFVHRFVDLTRRGGSITSTVNLFYPSKKILSEVIALPRNLQPVEWLFLLFTLTLFMGFISIGVDFAYIGVPLPIGQWLGKVRNFSPKLFITEIYLVLFGTIAIAQILLQQKSKQANTAPPSRRSPWQDHLFLTIIFLLTFGIYRFVGDNLSNPVWSIRNAAFVWYLTIPLAIAFCAIRPNVIESTFRITLLFVFFLFSGSLFYHGFLSPDNYLYPIWSASFSVYAPLALALVWRRSRPAALILIIIGFAYGVTVWSSIQRTSLAGCIVVTLLCFLFQLNQSKRFFKRLVVLALGFGIGFTFWPMKVTTIDYLRNIEYFSEKDAATAASSFVKDVTGWRIDPFDRGIEDQYGVEMFRTLMWRDAFKVFLAHPWDGVGFSNLVVFKQVFSENMFRFNYGYEGRPPISGPHNSYLNALARLGIVGALFLFLHIFAGIRLLINGYYAGFFVVFSHSMYAMFNVALEGPVRSLALLVGLSLALKVGPQKSFSQFLREKKLFSTSNRAYFFFHDKIKVAPSTLRACALGLFIVCSAVTWSSWKSYKEAVSSSSVLMTSIQQKDEWTKKEKLQEYLRIEPSLRGFNNKFFLSMKIGDLYRDLGQFKKAAEYYASAVRKSVSLRQETFALEALGTAFEADEDFDYAFMTHRINDYLAQEQIQSFAPGLSIYSMARIIERARNTTLHVVPKTWSHETIRDSLEKKFPNSAIVESINTLLPHYVWSDDRIY